MTEVNKKRAKKIPTPNDAVFSEPQFPKIEELVVNNVLLVDSDDNIWTADTIYHSAKELKIKGFGKADAHRLRDHYMKMRKQASANGPFYMNQLKLEIAEQQLKDKLKVFLGLFPSEDVNDIRDHTSDVQAVIGGTGAAWRKQVVEVLEKMEAAGIETPEDVQGLVEYVCPREMEQAALPNVSEQDATE